MGNCFASIFRRRRSRHIVLILIGLDNAGKTKTVNNLAGENDEKVLPTVGFKAVNLVHKDTTVTIYDLGGGPHFRQIWPQYYSEVYGVIFVIDSSDFSRLDECRSVLEEVISHDKISGKPVLVLANKQDKLGALDDIDVVEKLNIEPLVNKYRCPTLVESYSASQTTKSKKPKLDPGLKKGYQWLLNYIERRYGDINLRVQTDIHTELERRKRLLNKASDRASQTFTAVSDDIATQTGFANPKYETLPRKSSAEKDDQQILDSGLIIVKPITQASNSLDTTVTIESGAESENTSGAAKPKLSPLFGRASDSSTETDAKIELEPRSEYRKLSPLVRNKSGVDQHINFQNRPQSSPTINHLKQSNHTISQESVSPKAHTMEVYLGDRTWDGGKRTVHVDEAELSRAHREILLAEKSPDIRGPSSDILVGSRTLPAESPRPASASQLVRRQLELNSTQHKRRLSLRYMYRNKTNPESLGIFHYEPKSSQKQMEKGDFERNDGNYLAHRDVAL